MSEENRTNYQALFVIGIIFMGAGVSLAVSVGPAMYGLFVVGIVFFVIGIGNRDKWQS
jgi:hypothetical protein